MWIFYNFYNFHFFNIYDKHIIYIFHLVWLNIWLLIHWRNVLANLKKKNPLAPHLRSFVPCSASANTVCPADFHFKSCDFCFASIFYSRSNKGSSSFSSMAACRTAGLPADVWGTWLVWDASFGKKDLQEVTHCNTLVIFLNYGVEITRATHCWMYLFASFISFIGVLEFPPTSSLLNPGTDVSI